MSLEKQLYIREGLSIYSPVTVLPAQGKICVLHVEKVYQAVNAEAMMKLIGYFPYQIIPANLRTGYHLIYIL